MEERREDTGKITWRARNPGESWREEKWGTRTITDRKHSNLNIGTDSRVQIANALGKELHHSIMSKLWDSEAGPIDRHIKVNIVNIQIMGWIYGEASYNKGKFNSHFLYRNVVITLYSRT